MKPEKTTIILKVQPRCGDQKIANKWQKDFDGKLFIIQRLTVKCHKINIVKKWGFYLDPFPKILVLQKPIINIFRY